MIGLGFPRGARMILFFAMAAGCSGAGSASDRGGKAEAALMGIMEHRRRAVGGNGWGR